MPREKTILNGIDGILHPGEMLLVLGTPGSGVSSLLKVLAGKVEEYRACIGSITYSGIPAQIMRERFASMLGFSGAEDYHFPYLTVGQTLEFAASLKAPHQRFDGMTREKFIELTRDVLLATFGLQHTINTRVGNDFVRGVSGGERRRVSVAEMLLSRACVTCWDNPTRGLDSQTSLDFADALRTATDLTNNVSISALYQPGDSLAEKYDKVLLLHEGRQLFFGTLKDAEAYFENMGFERAPRQTIAEFLVSVTDPATRIVKERCKSRVPRTAQDFEATWRVSEAYYRLQREIESHVQVSQSNLTQEIERLQLQRIAEKSPGTRADSHYSLNIPQQFARTFGRSIQRIQGEYIYYLAVTITMLVIPVVMGTMFFDIDPGTIGFFSKGGVIFFAVLFNVFVNFAEVVAQFSQRPIVDKHKSYGFYHPYIDALASLVSQWPLKAFNIIVFTIIVYLMAGLKREAGSLMLSILFIFINTLTMTTWFRFIAAVASSVETALATAGLSVIALSIYAGYIIPRPSMHSWFKWISTVNPLFYTIESLVAIEFHGRKAPCQTIIPSGPGFENVSPTNQVCSVVGARPGQPFVLGDDYIQLALDFKYSHVWRNLVVSIAFFVFFTALYAAATEYVKMGSASANVLVFKTPSPWSKTQLNEDIETASTTYILDPEKSVEVRPSRAAIAASGDSFCWKHINYEVDIKGKKRQLLCDVQGYVEPGTMTALMGSSGAGKTTLLNVLAQRVNTGIVTGDATINGVPLDDSFKRRTGYCQQQDVHMGEMTVREALQFSALLRQPEETPIHEKYTYVEKIISTLGMEEYAEAIIGVPGAGLGIEKRKRTTIGLELVAKPSLLLFLDEPTSGLDSQSAISIVKLLRELADAGQAIVCTIHQPSSTLLNYFDRLLLLAKGGRTVYCGELGDNSQVVLDYFSNYGAPKCNPKENPAEYILEQIGAGAGNKATLDWPSIWNTSSERQDLAAYIHRLETKEGNTTTSISPSLSRPFATSWFFQYRTVQKRLFQQQWRSPTYITGKLAVNVVGGMFMSFTFFKENNSIQGLQNKTFAIFMILLLCLPLMVLLQPRLIALREIYDVREKFSNMYHWSVFVVASILVEIPFNIAISSLCFLGWFFPVGWWRDISDARGGFMYFVFILYQLYHTSFSQAIGTISPNAETASMLTILLYTFILAFSGVLQPLSQLINFWHFAYYVSPFTWLISAMMTTGTSGVPVKCTPQEVNVFQPPPGLTCGDYVGQFVQATNASLYNPEGTFDCQFCRFSTADVYLKTINMFFSQHWRNAFLLVGYTIFNVSFFAIGFYLYSGPGISGLLAKRRKR
ncbi:ABC-transporter [Corynespora cassiicola Philippines]|uniref:ABC-transporter n=1 Tax=Corynespora cassiicola Philippines TaxID=1448308 RepID=A0A2T2NZF5_CORCC|nr:ABC-transporter [Corynespora cassiicola Philippines]